MTKKTKTNLIIILMKKYFDRKIMKFEITKIINATCTLWLSDSKQLSWQLLIKSDV